MCLNPSIHAGYDVELWFVNVNWKYSRETILFAIAYTKLTYPKPVGTACQDAYRNIPLMIEVCLSLKQATLH